MAKLKQGEFEVEGVVTESLPDQMFRVQIEQGPEGFQGTIVLARPSGQMKMYHIKVMPGDWVRVLMTQYDKTKGRITFRLKETPPYMKAREMAAAAPIEAAPVEEIKPEEPNESTS